MDTEQLILILKNKEISQYKFAKKIGISTGHLSNIICGKISDPGFELVCKMADFLEVPLDILRKKE